MPQRNSRTHEVDNWKRENAGFEHDDYPVRFTAGPPPATRVEGSNTESTGYNGSNGDLRKRPSMAHMVVDVPFAQINRIAHTEGANAFNRETKHFAETTTMHGPKRIYQGKGIAMLFWAIIVGASLGFLITQVVILSGIYLSKPVISEVSFLINDDGMPFPLVTFCSLNPVKKSYALAMNATGDVPPMLLEYLMYYNTDAQSLYGGADRQFLHEGDNEMDAYQKLHRNFTADAFFMNAGFTCPEMFKLCVFEGRVFDCCQYVTPLLTSLGKCYTLDLPSSDKEWMHKQVEPGIAAGLQVILDAHIDEQFNGYDGHAPLFTNAFVDGYRYFVHPPETVPFLASDEITVSPNTVSYSAISSDRFVLLPPDQWGNCSEKWPQGFDTPLPYSSENCAFLCKARHFQALCGCSPALYNLDGRYMECTPYETFQCMDTKMRVVQNGTINIEMPVCTECRVECNSLVYRAYNSYGNGLSSGALAWLSKKDNAWNSTYMRSNFQIANVFFRDMSYTEYNQVQDSSLTQLLSDIGGNMGMFLGMSVVTITEISMFFSKMLWILISKKRREYMFRKKANEEKKKKEIDETVANFKVLSSESSMANLRAMISRTSMAPLDPEQLENNWAKQATGNGTRGKVSCDDDDNVQIKFDLRDIAETLRESGGVPTTAYVRADIQRSRANTADI